ncbi:MAG: hypothetical protein JWL83_771 [Actinomycetia bacterium]|jgi:hypothetical protein|nr:hypothetical protein [Actinomycetes bacterium]
MLWTTLRIVIALGAAIVLYLIAAAFVRNFAQAEAPPDEPDVTTLEDVDYRYRCIVCGAQAVMYSAPEGDPPEPPRHCREPMALIAPIA